MEIEALVGGALLAFVGDGRRVATAELDGDKLAVAADAGAGAKLDACVAAADDVSLAVEDDACVADGEVRSARLDVEVPFVEPHAATNARTRPEQAATPRRIFITMLD